ncbi:MAG: deoxyribodipyrimidine photo-lyase [Nitrospina sp.]|nr:deoxyribodipyrimidine photo-lyase [Nitrospina sp.]
MIKKTIIWLKNDLRLSDNGALNYAHKNNHELLFLYIFDESSSIGSASKWFLHKALDAFRLDIKQKYNAGLLIALGGPKQILEETVRKYDINSIVWNRVYEPEAIKRDIKIKEYFKESGLEVKTFNSSLLFEPSKIQNLSKSYFKVFTPFWKKCLIRINQVQAPHKIPESLHLVKIDSQDLFDLTNLELLPKNPNWAKKWDALYQVGEEEAHNLAEDFMNNRMLNYKEGRDFPATNNTSFLSPYIHFGLISPKQIYFKSMMFFGNSGLNHFLSEIGWREFSYHLLYHFKDLPTKNFKSKFDNFAWDNNQRNLEKWQKGITGFPLVDAGMRQLWQTGWMHNRVRMVVASFLTKNLLIDWRIGQEWFWDCLVDADLASNSASWQWVAGSGADAAPYFRIFNPITQSQRFDPKGDYIRKWVPEIAHLSDKEIHCPISRDEYPEAMVDLKFSRNRALAIYKGIAPLP